ncbi:(2Fe-2S)-binding protein [Marinobacter sp.]|uniref:(2Fe-2S)-binding protein n=1 Tax=Marinobacter sp. TaxID=50741 RepID=UPI003A9514A1
MAGPEGAGIPGVWSERYARLLQASGLDTKSVFGQALQPAPGERRALFSLAQCLEQPALLSDQVARDHPHVSDARAIRAQLSVLQQDLALSVIGPLTLRLFRDGRSPLPDPGRIFLAPVEQGVQAASRWFHLANWDSVDEPTFIRSLGRLASDWYPVFRKGLGVSPGAYWSSIGLGLGAPFSAVWNLAEPEALCDLAQRWLEEFGNDANQFIDWIPAVFGEKMTAIPQRKGCCLKYLLPEGGYCGTCGIYRKERFAALEQHSGTQGGAQGQTNGNQANKRTGASGQF